MAKVSSIGSSKTIITKMADQFISLLDVATEDLCLSYELGKCNSNVFRNISVSGQKADTFLGVAHVGPRRYK